MFQKFSKFIATLLIPVMGEPDLPRPFRRIGPPLCPLDRDDGVTGRELVEPEVLDLGGACRTGERSRQDQSKGEGQAAQRFAAVLNQPEFWAHGLQKNFHDHE